MSQWNQGQYPPDPSHKSGYPQDGYPPQLPQSGYAPHGDSATAPPLDELPPPSYSQATGFVQPPPLEGVVPHTPGEQIPLSNCNTGNYGFTSSVVRDNAAGCGEENVSVFKDLTVRRGFIKKVFSILSIQLSVILIIICWFFFQQSTKQFVQDYNFLFYVSMILLIVTVTTLALCDQLRRKSPDNNYFLFGFTLILSFCLACVTIRYEVHALPLSVGMTVVNCLGIALFVLQTNYKFSLMTGIYLIAILDFAFFLFFALLISINMIVSLTGALFSSMLFSVYLVYDTQLMMGGKHGTHMYSISPEEYIFAVLNLYVDGINIFRHIHNSFKTP